MNILIVDASPIFYGALFSASKEAKKNGLKLVDSKLPYVYEDIVVFKIFDELSTLKNKFQADEIIIATDNSEGGYWRKEIYPIYKAKRKGVRDDSEILWEEAFKTFNKVKEQIQYNTSFKMINVKQAEGDDVMFVLTQHLVELGHSLTLHSVDHDTVYNLRHPNVKWYRHVKTQKKDGNFQEVTIDEIETLELEHIIQGDGGDNIKNIKAYSQFSPKFKEIYPDKKEIDVYSKRFELDILFEKTYGESAYKHPPFGLKTFQKKKKPLKEFLKENKIYKENYNLNKILALPEGIPPKIFQSIVDEYNLENTKNYKELSNFFKEQNCFDLIGKLVLF